MPQATYRRLLELWAEISDLMRSAAVLYWDQQTCMPAAGAAARGEQLTTLRRLAHLRLTSPELGETLASLEGYEQDLPYAGDEAGVIRAARRAHERAVRVPLTLVVEQVMAGLAGHQAWREAREANAFERFRAPLERLVSVAREVASALGYTESPLDPLIGLREPGITARDCELLFDRLRGRLVALTRAIAARPSPGPDLLTQPFDPDRQLACGLAAVRAIGFDLDRRGRADLSIHPFTISFSPDDVRITTRINPGDFRDCFFALLHEAGHGLYEQGLPGRLARTPAGTSASSGVHESQSRLWENVVGRSREFWQFFLPRAAEFFPAQFGQAAPADLYRAANRVQPSLIRTAADEVTYNLHVMLRCELEKDTLEGRLAVADLPAAWNQKLQDYLGVTPPDDLTGVLQDIHWSRAFGGQFQGYTLGNVMAGQLYQTALAALPGLTEDFARGDFSRLLGWLRERVHDHAGKYEPLEIIRLATGEELTADPYLAYLETKFGELYGL